jgi:hypothetical protein
MRQFSPALLILLTCPPCEDNVGLSSPLKAPLFEN